jgi:hypothetical protein
MKRAPILTCLLGLLLGLLAVTVAWSADDSQTSGRHGKQTKKELNGTPTEPSSQSGDRDTKAKDPWEGKKRVQGWSTTVVLPPPAVYYGYNGYYGYPPAPVYYEGYYRNQPWGYEGPPVIVIGERYDSALVWDRTRQGFRWDPVIPPRPNSGVSGLIVNPNFVKPQSESPSPPDSKPAETTQSKPEKATADGSSAEQAPSPAKTPNQGNWQKRGLVSSVDRNEKQLTIITPEGQYAVDAREATVVENGYRVTLARISEGDALKVRAELTGLNKVRADRIEITGTKGKQAAADALKPITARGKIANIDYPSFTLKVETDSGELRVLAGEDTRISSPAGDRKAFMDLKLGQTVKIVAIGSLTSGYAASEVVIIEDSAKAKPATDE